MTLHLPPSRNINTPQAQSDPRLGIRRVKVLFDHILILVFLLGLFIPFQGVFRGASSKHIEETEGRKVAAFPEMHFKGNGLFRRPNTRSLKAFPVQFEKWFNDRIGCRRPLIQAYQLARYYGLTPALLSTSGRGVNPLEKEGVLVGRDGWLFYHSAAALADFRGTDLFTEAELAEWKQVLEERQNWLAQRGIRYVFVMVPEKHTIYPDNMPGSITRITTETRLQQLEDYLNRRSNVAVLNLTEPLVAAKADRRVFHKTDTHWNAYGAMIGAKALLSLLKGWFPEVHVPEMSDYEVAVHDCDPASIMEVSPWVKMDLAVMLGTPIPQREEVIELVAHREEDRAPIQFYGPPHSEAESIRRHAWDRGELSNVYLVHDSCMMAMAQFLAPHFREATYHWTHEFPAEEIEKARPVLVIQEMVQRRLVTHKPKNPPIVTIAF